MATDMDTEAMGITTITMTTMITMIMMTTTTIMMMIIMGMGTGMGTGMGMGMGMGMGAIAVTGRIAAMTTALGIGAVRLPHEEQGVWDVGLQIPWPCNR